MPINDLLAYENTYSHFQYIAGIDEAGRGAWAGPVCAAAVIMPKGLMIEGVDDSKKLSEKKREELFEKIKTSCISYGVGLVSADEIDRINILAATKKAMLMALAMLDPKPDFLMIDGKGMGLDTKIQQLSIIDGDALSHSIAAASIIAKVTRDRLMREYAKEYPGYAFERHVGYGTKKHQEVLAQKGVLEIHRKTYAPIKKIIHQSWR